MCVNTEFDSSGELFDEEMDDVGWAYKPKGVVAAAFA